jgi:opacity protein-like surface antigen
VVDATLGGWKVLLTDGGITHTEAPPIQDAAHATAFGLQAGLGLRYKINDKWGVMLGGDYYYSQPNFKITNENRNTSIGREITSYNEAITGINTNLTLVYILRH